MLRNIYFGILYIRSGRCYFSRVQLVIRILEPQENILYIKMGNDGHTPFPGVKLWRVDTPRKES